jgi:pyruvate formate-lyase activating enzyme-like uncharacterized protein
MRSLLMFFLLTAFLPLSSPANAVACKVPPLPSGCQRECGSGHCVALINAGVCRSYCTSTFITSIKRQSGSKVFFDNIPEEEILKLLEERAQKQ